MIRGFAFWSRHVHLSDFISSRQRRRSGLRSLVKLVPTQLYPSALSATTDARSTVSVVLILKRLLSVARTYEGSHREERWSATGGSCRGWVEKVPLAVQGVSKECVDLAIVWRFVQGALKLLDGSLVVRLSHESPAAQLASAERHFTAFANVQMRKSGIKEPGWQRRRRNRCRGSIVQLLAAWLCLPVVRSDHRQDSLIVLRAKQRFSKQEAELPTHQHRPRL
mmetsp:Transcript_11048/g.41271  ORF Transcript_11048/g.41271 Transcript_11048/m.41271 type:complete len:223 (-) Transcript_11048:363-1031(-)